MSLNACAGIEKPGRFAPGGAAAKVCIGGDLSEAGAGHAQIEDARVAISLSQQSLRRIHVLPPESEAHGQSQRCSQAAPVHRYQRGAFRGAGCTEVRGELGSQLKAPLRRSRA